MQTIIEELDKNIDATLVQDFLNRQTSSMYREILFKNQFIAIEKAAKENSRKEVIKVFEEVNAMTNKARR